MFPKWIKYILKYYSLWGFHSLPNASVGGKFGGKFIFIVHIILCIWCTISTFTTFIEEQSLMEFIDSVNFLLFYITSASCYWFIIYDSYTKQAFQQKFWNIFWQINETFCFQKDFNIWSYVIALIIIFTGDLSVLIISLVYEYSIGSPSCV